VKKLVTATLRVRFVRFLCTGGLNTAVTYVIYLLLLQVLNYQFSYAIAYVSGIAIGFLLNRLFVFETHRGWKSLALYPFIYLAQYLSGAMILWLVVGQMRVKTEVGPLVVVILTIPLTYWLSKLAFIGYKNTAIGGEDEG
jgi:putative flippase GtrA